MSAQPWMKFYPADWRADPALRMCGLAARGLWIEMLSIMHEADPRGSLVINGKPVSVKHLSSLVGSSEDQVSELLTELSEAGVYSTKRNGILYSRRMERDEQKTRKLRDNGKLGGNPNLRKQTTNEALDNQVVITTEARSQIPDKETEDLKKTREPIEELTKVVDAERAAAVVEHRTKLDCALTPYASRLLAAELAKCPDPNAAADAMIKNGWQGFNADLFNAELTKPKGAYRSTRAPPATGSVVPYAERQQRIREQQRRQQEADISPETPLTAEQQAVIDRFRAARQAKEASH